MQDALHRLWKTRLTLLATVATVAGVALLLLAHWALTNDALVWLVALPVTEVGSALFTTGLIAIFFEYIDAKDADERATQRLRRVLAEEAPAIRDAVIHGFAFQADDLARVASPGTLDQVVRNALAIQLRDRALAEEVYADMSTQVLRAPERHADMRVSVTLAPRRQGPAAGPGSMFVATVRREYRVRPQSPILRFSCVSDLTEYRELVRDPSSTEVWYFEPVAGLTSASSEAYQMLQFTVDGVPRSIRRSKRTAAQLYTVDLGKYAGEAAKEVTVSYTYRVLVQQHSHMLALDFGRPCRGVQVDLAYGGCGIRHVSVLDFITSAEQVRTTRTPDGVPTPSVGVSFDGWVFPKSGVAFVWVLEGEMTTGKVHSASERMPRRY